MMFFNKLNQKLSVLLYDSAAIPCAWYLAFWLRYNLQPFPASLTSKYALFSLGVLFCVQIACYYHCKVYRGLWQFVSLNDLLRIIRSAVYAVMIAIPIFYLTTTIQHIPRSVLPLYAMILCLILSVGRVLRRIQWDRFHRHGAEASLTRVLIIGAGQAGEGLIRDLIRAPQYVPVGVVDDNPGKLGLDLRGVLVVGSVNHIPSLVKKLKVDLIFIAIPSARSSQMRRIVDICEASAVPFRTLPSLSALADGRVELNALREVGLEDLLGRDEVMLDWHKIQQEIVSKRVVVTGGGGSIGSELCRQILKLQPAQLILIDNTEHHLYLMEQEIQALGLSIQVDYILANITDAKAMRHWFMQFKPHLVFHAAAYKHVPLLESRIRAAVLNNVIGTQVIAEASIEAGAHKFILISSDKAVNPTNVMGASKRIAEIYCQNLNERVATQFITVRFGNVLGSKGSVVPLFRKQLEAGGPLTVTHPDIERYFMTIPEACQLILQSTVNGVGGEIFVLDMGEPIKIRYLAEQMIRLSGREIDIVYTGLRPGEKLYEELFHSAEALIQTEHEKLFKAAFRAYSWEELVQTMTLLTTASEAYDEEELRFLIQTLVPEFNNTLELTLTTTP